jgi:diguanylate cyclase (GGDEF)-like protein
MPPISRAALVALDSVGGEAPAGGRSPGAAAAAPATGPLGPAELRPMPVFQAIDVELAAARLKGCRELALPPGAVLLQRGRRSRNAFLVVEGLLGVHSDPDDASPYALARVGEIVGELSVLSGGAATMEVRAVTPSRVLEIDEDTFFCLIYESHMFAVNVLMMLTARLRTSALAVSAGAARQRALEDVASRDALTGLHNRRWLDQALPASLEGARREGRPLAVVMVDIDHFKRINDTYGHGEGDRVLVAVAHALTGGLRQSDQLARCGGEEFAVLLPGAGDPAARAVAERLRAAVAATALTLQPAQSPERVTVSVGLAFLRPGDDATQLLGRADRALYRAKAAGRDRVEVEGD